MERKLRLIKNIIENYKLAPAEYNLEEIIKDISEILEGKYE